MQSDLMLLPIRFERNGFLFWQVCRTFTAAIYEQRTKDGRGIWFEVWRVRIRPAEVIFSRHLPKREVIPGGEAWGTDGWTYYRLKDARIKYDELNNRPNVQPDRKTAVTGQAEGNRSTFGPRSVGADE